MATPEIVFLQDLAIVTGVAALASIVFQKLRFPLVFGLLAAGVIIGPHTPPFGFIQDEASLEVLANLGVVLLLFGLGLEFDLRQLKKFGLPAAIITVAEVGFMFWVGYELGRILGWAPIDSVYLGAMLSISSTAIIVSVLREMKRMEAESSRILFAVLVLEDIAAIIILVLLSGYSATGHLPLRDAGLVAAQMALFLVALVLIGLLIVPRFLDWVAKRFRPEILVLAVIGVALGGAMLSEMVGFHVGLGAFIMGALAAEARHKNRLEERFKPIHDLFAAIFFVAIGTLVDFQVLAQYWQPVAIVTIAIIVGKILSGTAATFLAGFSSATAFGVGSALAQIGEFSFVIAALGLTTGVMDPTLFSIIVGTAAITSFTSPMTMRFAEPLGHALGRLVPISLRTYAAVYTSFIQNWRARPGRAPAALKKQRRATIVSGSLLIATLGGAMILQRNALTWLESYRLDAVEAVFLYWGAALVLIGPSTYEFNRHLGQWIDEADAGRAEGIGVRAVVRNTVLVGVALLVGLPALLATGPLLGNPLLLVLWLALVLGVGLMLVRGIARLHHRVSDNLGRILEQERAPVPIPDVLETLMSSDFPLQFGIDSVTVAPSGVWSGKTLGEARLRTATGASLILIERADGGQLIPQAQTRLLPGDRLILMGGAPQIASARALLEQTSGHEPGRARLHPGKLFVDEGSKLDGSLLVESGLRDKWGLQVVAIQRETEFLPNPSPSERIRAGDVLVVLGTQDQVFAAMEDAKVSASRRR